MSTLIGFDPASTYQKIILHDNNSSISITNSPFNRKVVNTYTGIGENVSSSMFTGAISNIQPGVIINLTNSGSYCIGDVVGKGIYLYSGQTFNGSNYSNVGYTITGDGLTHSYLINFYMTGRFFDTTPSQDQTNRFWIQPTFNGQYDGGVIGPGGIEVFGLCNESNNNTNPSSISNIRIVSSNINYIYATNSTSWKLDMLLTSRNVWNGSYADGFKFDESWMTIKTIY